MTSKPGCHAAQRGKTPTSAGWRRCSRCCPSAPSDSGRPDRFDETYEPRGNPLAE